MQASTCNGPTEMQSSVNYDLTSRFRAKLRMSLSVMAEESCSSLLASAAGDKIARRPTKASTYDSFILIAVQIRGNQRAASLSSCYLQFAHDVSDEFATTEYGRVLLQRETSPGAFAQARQSHSALYTNGTSQRNRRSHRQKSRCERRLNFGVAEHRCQLFMLGNPADR